MPAIVSSPVSSASPTVVRIAGRANSRQVDGDENADRERHQRGETDEHEGAGKGVCETLLDSV